MKKYISILLLITALVLSGCGKQTTEPAATAALETPSSTTAEPAPTEPDSVTGKVLIPHLGAVLGTLPVGEEVSVMSEDDGYCLVDTSVGPGLIEKRLLRMGGEPEFEGYTGYAKSGAVLYKDYLMLTGGEPLAVNTELVVLQAFDGGFMVQLSDGIGYVAADLLSQRPVTGGGNSGGSSGTNDGGDISLTSAAVPGGRVCMLADSSFATVIVDDAEVYAAFLNRDDSVKVTEVTDEACTIYMDGSFLTVPRCFVQLEGDEPFESYTGYAHWNAAVYGDYTMAGTPLAELEINKEITVLGDFGNCLMVDVDGTLCFMKADAFGKQPAAPGNSGAGDNSTWTPPAL